MFAFEPLEISPTRGLKRLARLSRRPPSPRRSSSGGSCRGGRGRCRWAWWVSPPLRRKHWSTWEDPVSGSSMIISVSAPILLMFVSKLMPSLPGLLNFPLQFVYLLQFSLPAVLSGHFIFSPPPYVSADVKLLLWQVLLAQHVVKLVHGRLHYVLLETLLKPFYQMFDCYFDAELDAVLSGQFLILVEPHPSWPEVVLSSGLGALAGLWLAAGGGVLVSSLGLHQLTSDGEWRGHVRTAQIGIGTWQWGKISQSGGGGRGGGDTHWTRWSSAGESRLSPASCWTGGCESETSLLSLPLPPAPWTLRATRCRLSCQPCFSAPLPADKYFERGNQSLISSYVKTVVICRRFSSIISTIGLLLLKEIVWRKDFYDICSKTGCKMLFSSYINCNDSKNIKMFFNVFILFQFWNVNLCY